MIDCRAKAGAAGDVRPNEDDGFRLTEAGWTSEVECGVTGGGISVDDGKWLDGPRVDTQQNCKNDGNDKTLHLVTPRRDAVFHLESDMMQRGYCRSGSCCI